jgi:hypothetical protein
MTDTQDQSNESYSLSLKGPGISVEREVSREVATAVVEVVMRGGRGWSATAWAASTGSDIRSAIEEALDRAFGKREPPTA